MRPDQTFSAALNVGFLISAMEVRFTMEQLLYHLLCVPFLRLYPHISMLINIALRHKKHVEDLLFKAR